MQDLKLLKIKVYLLNAYLVRLSQILMQDLKPWTTCNISNHFSRQIITNLNARSETIQEKVEIDQIDSVRLSQILVQKTKITKSHNSEIGSRISYHKIVQN